MAGKRGYGNGTVYERKNRAGKVIGYRGQQALAGERRSYTGTTRREVDRQMEEDRVAFTHGRLGPKHNETLGDYLSAWLDTMRVTGTVRPRTLEAYESKVRLYLLPHLAHIRLDQLKATHIQECYNRLSARELSPQTVVHAHRVLHRALEAAVKNDLIARNPADTVDLPRVPRKEMCTLSAGQLDALFTATRGDRFNALWVLLGTSGLRLGEAMGLKWDDIDFPSRRLTVRRALQRQRNGKGLVFVEPKSATSRRTVELSDVVCQALQEHKERQTFQKRTAKSAWQEQGLVFSTVIGTPMAPEHIKRFFDAALETAALPHVRIHDLRHSAATLVLHELGLPVKLVSEMLGHSSVGITLSTYGHVIPGMHRAAAEQIGALFSGEDAAG